MELPDLLPAALAAPFPGICSLPRVLVFPVCSTASLTPAWASPPFISSPRWLSWMMKVKLGQL